MSFNKEGVVKIPKLYRIIIEVICVLLLLFGFAKFIPAQKNMFVIVLNNLGIHQMENERYSSALKLFSFAKFLRSDYPRLYMNISVCYEKMGSMEESLEFAHRAVDLTKGSEHHLRESLRILQDNMVSSKINTGIQLLINGKPEAAMQSFENILLISPNHRDASYYKAIALLDLKREIEALQELQNSIVKGVKDARVYCLAGDILFRRAKYKQAITIYKKTIQLKPKNEAQVLNDIAICYNRINNQTEALKYSKRAIAKAPKNLQFKYSYTNILRDAGQYDTALKGYIYLERKKFQKGIIAYDMMGIYLKKNNYSKALEKAKIVIEIITKKLKKESRPIYYHALKDAYALLKENKKVKEVEQMQVAAKYTPQPYRFEIFQTEAPIIERKTSVNSTHVIYLNNGRKTEGVLKEQTFDYVLLQIPVGSGKAEIKIHPSTILKIEKK